MQRGGETRELDDVQYLGEAFKVHYMYTRARIEPQVRNASAPALLVDVVLQSDTV